MNLVVSVGKEQARSEGGGVPCVNWTQLSRDKDYKIEGLGVRELTHFVFTVGDVTD